MWASHWTPLCLSVLFSKTRTKHLAQQCESMRQCPEKAWRFNFLVLVGFLGCWLQPEHQFPPHFLFLTRFAWSDIHPIQHNPQALKKLTLSLTLGWADWHTGSPGCWELSCKQADALSTQVWAYGPGCFGSHQEATGPLAQNKASKAVSREMGKALSEGLVESLTNQPWVLYFLWASSYLWEK